jgi:hypothetical protein
MNNKNRRNESNENKSNVSRHDLIKGVTAAGLALAAAGLN